MTRTLPMFASLFALGLVAQAVWAAPVPLSSSSATSSSSLPPDEGGSYDAGNLVDGKQSTVWVEGDEGSGLGAWVELTLPAPTKVTAIKIWNGNYYSYDFWQRHNRVDDL